MDRWKPEMGRVREKRRVEERRAEERRSEKKMQVREKVGKSRNTVFFQWFVAPEGRQVGSLKRRARSHLARWEMKNCTPLWREAHFQVKTNKTPGARSTFGSWDVEKAHAVGARSTFWSQNAQNTPGPDHFWQLRCRKKCTRWWREAHFEVKMYKTHQVRTTFGSWDVEKVHAVVARSTFRSQNVKNTRGSVHFWRFRCRKSARGCGTSTFPSQNVKNTRGSDVQMSFPVAGAKDCAPCQKWAKREGFVAFSTTTTPHYTPIHFTTTTTTPSLHSTTLHYTTLHYIPLHYTNLQSITLNYTQLRYTTLYYTTLPHTTLHSTRLHYTTLHYTTLHYTTLYYTTLHSTTLHYTTLHFTTLHYTTLQLHYTTFHYYTTLHYTPLHSNSLHYTTLHSTTLHDTTLHYTNYSYYYNYNYNNTTFTLRCTTLH